MRYRVEVLLNRFMEKTFSVDFLSWLPDFVFHGRCHCSSPLIYCVSTQESSEAQPHKNKRWIWAKNERLQVDLLNHLMLTVDVIEYAPAAAEFPRVAVTTHLHVLTGDLAKINFPNAASACDNWGPSKN